MQTKKERRRDRRIEEGRDRGRERQREDKQTEPNLSQAKAESPTRILCRQREWRATGCYLDVKGTGCQGTEWFGKPTPG